MKLYTAGQVGKKYKISLYEVFQWSNKVHRLYQRGRRGFGILPIEDDPYFRGGMPAYLVDVYPKVLPQPTLYLIEGGENEDIHQFIIRLHKQTDFIYQLLTATNKEVRHSIEHALEEGKSIIVNGYFADECLKKELALWVKEFAAKLEVIALPKTIRPPVIYRTKTLKSSEDEANLIKEILERNELPRR